MRAASAQTAIILSSTSVGQLNLPAPAGTLRAPGFAVCDPSGKDCRGLHPYQIKMEVFPHWEFRVPLPSGFMLCNHNWTMEHDAVDLSLRQAMIGGTLRYQHGDFAWIELGAAVAERSLSHPDDSNLLASGDIGRMTPALLAGVGGWVHLGDHMELDLRLRGGASVSDDGAARVYQGNFVAAFAWR
jgi:hypothetical protein